MDMPFTSIRPLAMVILYVTLSTIVLCTFPQPVTPVSSSTLSQQQDEDVVRVSTDLVVLNATVLNKDGKFVGGLKRGDFQVFEDGNEQKISAFSTEETPFAAAILLISPAAWNHA